MKPPTITLQVVGCPTLSINWDSLIGTHSNVNKVQKVTCSNLEGGGSLQALVNVRYYTPDAKLDVYVYDNLSGTPAQRFKVQGLVDGDAQISPTGTITTAEIGVHMAMGAAPARIFSLVVGHGIRLSAAGILLGFGGALGLTRVMTSMLVGVKPTDLATLAVVAVLFFAIAALASWVPARRAAALDPTSALREE